MKIYKSIVFRHGHELANKVGSIRKSRYVLYEKLEGNPGNCNWCGIPLTWNTLCADHLDSNIMNDAEENLVGSCRGCNANREDGTGHGRTKPKVCPECNKQFVVYRPAQIYCSVKCASCNRPKRGIKSKHGTRSRYVSGCKCRKCKTINTKYWMTKYKTKNNYPKYKLNLSN